MRKRKEARRRFSRGMTLVEMLVSVALLTVIMAAAGSAIYAAAQSYAVTRKMQDDEYNLRLALLSISREVHRGVTEVSVTAVDAGAGRRLDRLSLKAHDEATDIEYIIGDPDGDGVFTLRQEVTGGTTPVPFASVELESFAANLADGRWLNIELIGRYGLKLETTIAIFRVPAI